MSMPTERPMANNYLNRFFGGPPLSVMHDAHDQPDRYHHGGAEEEIAPEPAHRIEAHVRDVQHEPFQAFDDVPGIEPDYLQDHPDQDRQQDQPEDDRQRRPTKEPIEVIVGHRPLRRHAHDNILSP